MKFFTNIIYRIFPPESVSYWKNSDSTRAKVIHDKEGALQMVLEGEKHPFPALPRGHVLLSSVGKIKHVIKTKIFNAAWKEIAKEMSNAEMDMIPVHKSATAVREMARVLDEMVEMEVVEDMKERMKLLRNVIVFLAQEDDAYRFRMQYFFENMKKSKIKLSRADKYYARGKYWRVDYKKFDY